MRAADALDLARSLREVVLPLLGAHAARAHEAEKAVGGDITFAIDARAEEHLASWVAQHAPGVAFYSEDQGLVGPRDAARSVLCVQEAGAVVTDAHGAPLDQRPMLGSGVEHQMSCVAAANATLHRKVLGGVESGIERLFAAVV